MTPITGLDQFTRDIADFILQTLGEAKLLRFYRDNIDIEQVRSR